jgi:hypothetical protein
MQKFQALRTYPGRSTIAEAEPGVGEGGWCRSEGGPPMHAYRASAPVQPGDFDAPLSWGGRPEDLDQVLL